MQYRNFVIEILKLTSKIANRSFGKVAGIVKEGDNNQVLTVTDIEIGKVVINKIKEQYPTYNLIDEEAGIIDNNSSFTWVVDPIDGTSNFANGIPLYGIMIGLLKDSTPIAGGIALPFFDEIYFAEKGFGAFCNGEKLHVTKEEKLMSALIAYAIDGHQENPDFTKEECSIMAKIILNIRNIRRTGSCYDTTMVAKGKFGGYLTRTSKIWDNVAQQIIVEESGGINTDFFGKPIDYSNPLTKIEENYSFCAASVVLHKKLQEIIHKF